MEQTSQKAARYGMVIDLDRCTGCGACMMACAVENNVPPAAMKATERTGITWMRVYEARNDNGNGAGDTAYIPMMCQQCGHETPCMSVCPQNAVDVDPATGIVGQVPQRCLGCRYCMTACPYHARYFNWWDPAWPDGMEAMLNPDIAPRMRGVVEKCNFCHGRLHEAKAKAALAGKTDIDPADYVPACVESCPTKAIVFGDLADPSSKAAALAEDRDSFQFLAKLGTRPKVYYRTERSWVKASAEGPAAKMESATAAK